jgi:NAD(P)-dependent dehydrogenase (short-subunit alcohol dehydrogenase family)
MSVAPLDRAVVVTGASTGIGRAIAERVVAEGGLAFAGVRRQADADALVQALGPNLHPLLFDVTDEAAVRASAAVAAAKLAGRTLFGLVNNAGVAVPGALLHLDSDALRQQFEVNFIGVHSVTRAFAPLLGAAPGAGQPKGRIVMMSSVSGKAGAPFLGPYAASKHALEGYSESLRRELMIYGIDVIIIGPGAIATPIWGKGEGEDFSRYAGTPYESAIARLRTHLARAGETGLPAEDVAALVWKALTLAQPRTRYALSRRRLSYLLPAMLPKRFVDRAIAKRLGLQKQS